MSGRPFATRGFCCESQAFWTIIISPLLSHSEYDFKSDLRDGVYNKTITYMMPVYIEYLKPGDKCIYKGGIPEKKLMTYFISAIGDYIYYIFI